MATLHIGVWSVAVSRRMGTPRTAVDKAPKPDVEIQEFLKQTNIGTVHGSVGEFKHV